MLLPSGKMEQPLYLFWGLADVIALWPDRTATLVLKDGRCYCQVVDVMAMVYLCDDRCYSQVSDGITTQSGWWYLVYVITKLADGITMGSIFFMLILVLRCYTEPHPRYMADGTCQCFYSGMDYWPWCSELLWWFSLGSGPLFPLYWSYLC